MANNKNNQLGLSGSSLYNWKAKSPMEISQDIPGGAMPPARKPSGASAPRYDRSLYEPSPGVANSAGVPKSPKLVSTGSPRQPNLYGGRPAIPSASDYSDYNMKTNMRNSRVGANNESMDAMNRHFASGGSLKADNGKLSNLYGEQDYQLASRDAANINTLYAHELGKRGDYNEKQNDMMDRYNSYISNANNSDETRLGVNDMSLAKNELAKLTAQYNVFQKANGPDGQMKFTDFVQAKVNAGEIPYGSGALRVIQDNYGSGFSAPRPSVDDSSGRQSKINELYRDGSQDVEKWKSDRQKSQADGYNPDWNQAQRDGYDQRRAAAASQGRDMSARASLISQGYSPQQAGELVGRNNSIQNYYNTAIQQQALPAQIAANTERYKADAGVYSDMYKTDALVGDKRSERADAKEIRKYEQDKAKQAQDLEFAAQASAMHNGEDPYQVGTKANRDFENRRRVRDGLPPAPAPTIDRTMDKIKEDTSIDIKNPNAIASIHRKAEESNASEGEQLDIIGRSLGRDVKNPDEAVKVIEEMLRDVRSQAALAGAKNSGAFKSGDDAFYSTEDAAMATYGKTINLLAKSLPKDKLDAILSQHAKEMAGVRNSNSASTAEWAGNGLTWYKKYIDDAGSAAVGKLREIF